MGIEGVGLQLDEGQGDVRAVVGYALKVGEQVIENEALIQGTHTSLKAVDVVAFHFVAQGVHDLLQGLYPACA